MTQIIDPSSPAPRAVSMQLSLDTAKALASILSEYALRIEAPKLPEDKTEDEKKMVEKILDERKKFATAVAQSLWAESQK